MYGASPQIEEKVTGISDSSITARFSTRRATATPPPSRSPTASGPSSTPATTDTPPPRRSPPPLRPPIYNRCDILPP